MSAERLRWPAEALWQALEPLLPGLTVEVLAQIDSSNSELMRRCRAGRSEPLLLVAEQQTAGRGRMGRRWHSPPASSLTFSLGLPLAPPQWSGLSLVVGVSVAEALQALGVRGIGLKWPNDLWLGQAKLAGILVETASLGTQRYAVVGVGVNLSAPSPGWAPPDAGPDAVPPAWLDLPLDAPAVLGALIPPLVRDLLEFQAAGWTAFASRFEPLDLLRGRRVRLSDGREGQALGVGATGALRLLGAQGMQEVVSGEVSVRPAP